MSPSRKDDFDVADKMASGVMSFLFLGIFLLFRGLGSWLAEMSQPVYPGLVIGYRRSSRRPVTVGWHVANRHAVVRGATGAGKSTTLLNMARQAIQAGYGLAVISPKADLIEDLLPHIPATRGDDVILLDPTDGVRPVTFNILDSVAPQLRTRTASEVLSIFKRFHADSWGPRLEHVLRMVLLALVEAPGSTLASIPRLLLDDAYRHQVLSHVTNPAVLQFWRLEYATMSSGLRAQVTQPILNKVSSLLAYPQVYASLSSANSSFQMEAVMDEGKILLCHLPQGLLGEDVSAFLGGLLVSKIQLAAMARAAVAPSRRRLFLVFIDEFQTMAANGAESTFTKFFTEARAFNVGLICVHQYEGQLSRALLDAVEHNVATSLTCQLENGIHTLLYRQPQDPARPEEALIPLSPLDRGDVALAHRIRQSSRWRYGRPVRRARRRAASQPQLQGANAHVAFFQVP